MCYVLFMNVNICPDIIKTYCNEHDHFVSKYVLTKYSDKLVCLHIIFDILNCNLKISQISLHVFSSITLKTIHALCFQGLDWSTGHQSPRPWLVVTVDFDTGQIEVVWRTLTTVDWRPSCWERGRQIQHVNMQFHNILTTNIVYHSNVYHNILFH